MAQQKIVLIFFILFCGTLLSACDAQFTSEQALHTSGVICEDCSLMTVSAPNIADGVTPTYVDLRVVDTLLQPIPSVSLTLEVGEMSGSMTTTNCTVSDAEGKSRCRVYAVKAGEKVVQFRGWRNKRKVVNFRKPFPLRNLYSVVSGGSYKTASGLFASPNVLKDNNGKTRFRAFHLGGSFDE